MFSTAFSPGLPWPPPRHGLPARVCRLIRHCHNLLHSHFRIGFIELATRLHSALDSLNVFNHFRIAIFFNFLAILLISRWQFKLN